MKLSTLHRRLALFIAWACLISVKNPIARSAGSLSDIDFEYRELQGAFDKVLAENRQLRNALVEAKKSMAEVKDNLAAASGESGLLQRQVKQMKLRMDALGIDTAGGNDGKLQQRLLAAVSDLRVAAMEKRKLSEALVRISEAAAYYAKAATGADPQSRLALEAEIRNANAVLGVIPISPSDALNANASITNGSVISVEEDLSLVVVNVGSIHGVRNGMPFEIVRDEKVIATVRVVDVREKISGAIIQNPNSDKDRIKYGDHLRVNAQH